MIFNWVINMKKNSKEALIKLLSGISFIVLLIGLFTPAYPFMYGLIAAIAIGIIAGVLAKYLGVEKTKK